METNLKSRIFKLLKEDEEFRHAIIGMLGLEDIKTAILSLEKTVSRLIEGYARLEAGYARLENTVAKLVEGQARLDEAVAKLAEGYARLENTVAKLVEGQARFMEAMAETRRDIAEIRRELTSTRSELGGLSSSVGAMSESMAREALRKWLKEKGLAVDRIAPIKVKINDRGVEVNFYGKAMNKEGMQINVYAEAKSAIKAREVKDFARIAAEAEKIWGKGIKLIIAFRIYEDAYQAAEEEGIQIIEA
jgi:exonuclease VII small subunit